MLLRVTGHPGPVPYYVDAAEEVLTVLNGRGLLQACDSRYTSNTCLCFHRVVHMLPALSKL